MWVGFAMAVGFYLVDSLMDAYIFADGSFPELLYKTRAEEFWLRGFGASLLIALGASAQYMTVRRNQAQELLRDSEEKYRSVVEYAPSIVAMLDREGIVWYSNPGWRGTTPDAEFGSSIYSWVVPEDHELMRERLERVFEHGEAVAFETRRTASNDAPVWFQTRIGPMRGSAGTPMAVCVSVDITERKMMELALRASEEQFRSVLEVSRDLIYKLNVGIGAYEYVSPSVLTLTGFSPKEFIDLGLQGVAERCHPETRNVVLANSSNLPFPDLGAHEVPEVEYRWKRKDGVYRWFRNNRSVVRDEQGQIIAIVGVTSDITDRKEAEEALQQAREELESKVQSRMEIGGSYGLTFREMTVLHLVADGKADKEIAATLGIRPLTVSKHVSNILGKMDCHSRTEAGMRAIREGLLD